jgi:hypothetical protein
MYTQILDRLSEELYAYIFRAESEVEVVSTYMSK